MSIPRIFQRAWEHRSWVSWISIGGIVSAVTLYELLSKKWNAALDFQIIALVNSSGVITAAQIADALDRRPSRVKTRCLILSQRGVIGKAPIGEQYYPVRHPIPPRTRG